MDVYGNCFDVCDIIVTGRLKNRTTRDFDQKDFKRREGTFG